MCSTYPTVATGQGTQATFPTTFKFKPAKWAIRGLTHVAMVVKDVSLVGPVVQLILTLTAESHFRKLNLGLSSRAQERLAEMETRVQSIAQRAGIADYHRFKVVAGPAASSPGAVGKFTLLIPAECLLKAEDLPSDLSIDQLDQDASQKAEWTDQCICWLNQTFDHAKRTDSRDAYLLKFRFKHPTPFEEIDDALFSHEIGHCFLDHTARRAWIRFAWQLLAIPTLTISTLYEESVMQSLSLSFEEEADIFAATKANGAEGLFTYFSIMLFIGKVYHEKKLFKGFDAEGNYTKDKTHPLATTRTAYLAKLANNIRSPDDQALLFLRSL